MLLGKSLQDIASHVEYPPTMDNPWIQGRMREICQASMPAIIRNYPRYAPYFGFEWRAIFIPIERNAWATSATWAPHVAAIP
jgi:hypothetical protein